MFAFAIITSNSVSILKKYSCWRGIEIGVPQGSVLKLWLFLLYINDLPRVGIFPDDTAVMVKTKTKQERDDWVSDNSLQPYVSKTQLIIFKPKRISKIRVTATK